MKREVRNAVFVLLVSANRSCMRAEVRLYLWNFLGLPLTKSAYIELLRPVNLLFPAIIGQPCKGTFQRLNEVHWVPRTLYQVHGDNVSGT